MRRKTLLARSCSLRSRAARVAASRSEPRDLRPIRSASMSADSGEAGA